MKIVSYSRNVFLPVTNLCRNSCAYCGFRREPGEGAWFMFPEEVLSLAKKAKKMGCSEALITLGERPEVHREARERLDELGFRSMVDYIEYLCRKILEIGLLPHTNAGVLRPGELKQLRRYNASMGLMLECIADLPAHRGSPGKNPVHRLQVIEAAGELRIPFTTGLLVGIGESHEDRIKSLLAIKELHRRYGHIQEVIIQPFEPKPGTPMANHPRPAPSELLAIVSAARSLLPGVGIQVPPNLVHDFCLFLRAGANDLGGISPLTPDFINPGQPWPSIAELRAAIRRAGFRPRERLPIYPRYVKDVKFMSEEVEKVVREVADEEGYRTHQT